jgi:hypothetical protein
VLLAASPSCDDLQAALLNEMQQLERCACGLLLPDLPLLNGREARVEEARKHRLADVRAFADASDLGGLQRLDRWQPARVELAQRDLFMLTPALCSPFAVSRTASMMGDLVLRIAIDLRLHAVK